jgi:predicted permease
VAFSRRIANLFYRSKIAREIDDELRSHIEMRIEDNIAGGMSPEQARRDAVVRFGSPSAIRENVQAKDAALGIEVVIRDFIYAFRHLRKSPGFTITAVLTLALGIAANVVVFSVMNALIFRPLNSPQLRNLHRVAHKHDGWDGQSYPNYLDYRDRNKSFNGMIAQYGMSIAGLSRGTYVRKTWGYDVSGNYFDVLGVQPELGRFFHAEDERGANSAPYIVLSDRLWRGQFNADPQIVGSIIGVNKHPFTVLGVAPASFHGIELLLWPDYWIPIVNEQQIEGWDFLRDRMVDGVSMFGRLKPGVTAGQAADDLNRIARDLRREYPTVNEGLDARLIEPGLMGDGGQAIRAFLTGIMVLALLVLLATCANLASIFAARAAERSRELAIRLAIGSSRWHILRQLLLEAVLVSLTGGLAGTAISIFLLAALSRWQPFGDMPERILVSPDLRVYVFALTLSLATGLLFGLIPGRQIWHTDAAQMMKTGSTAVAGFRRFSLRDLLLTVQIALCTLLITASLVALRGMVRSLHAPLGFEPQGAMLAEMDLDMAGYGGDTALSFQRRLVEEAERSSGVSSAGTINFTPMSGWGPRGLPVFRPGTVDLRPSNSVFGTRIYSISPDYLPAAGTRLLTGRSFTWHDDAKTTQVAIVNETFAQRLLGHAPAIGERFQLEGKLLHIVGVVEDGKYYSLTEDPEAAVFLPIAQYEQSNTTLVVRSRLQPPEISSVLQTLITNIDPNVPYTVRSWPDALASVLFPARAATMSLGIMGCLAVMLAITGIFGMAAYSVSKRMKEFGIRMAVGAQRIQLVRTALGGPLVLLLSGSAAGLLLGVLSSRLLAQIVYLATPGDPLVLCGVILAMAMVGMLATWLPARRALTINPAKLLRDQ